jgi:Domain of unknown function (DUF3576)
MRLAYLSTMRKISALSLLGLSLLIVACDSKELVQDVPTRPEMQRVQRRGRLSGNEWGVTIFGGSPEENGGSGTASPLGVNGYLWRATLDSLSFLPLASADPFGGVILTDWYEDANTPDERFKLNVLILDKSLRADAIKVTAFKQQRDGSGWKDVPPNADTARKIEDAILTRARELKIKQGG